MSSEICNVGYLTALPTPIQQQYDQLQAPQCTNLTYISTFASKLLFMTYDADIREILCHLNDAVSKLNRIHVRITISSISPELLPYNYFIVAG